MQDASADPQGRGVRFSRGRSIPDGYEAHTQTTSHLKKVNQRTINRIVEPRNHLTIFTAVLYNDFLQQTITQVITQIITQR